MLAPLISSLLIISNPAPADVHDITYVCEPGPIVRTLVGQPWEVYGCSDGRTLLFVAKGKGSTDDFIYYVLSENGRTVVDGRGTGGGRDIAATTQELRKLTASDIAALIEATSARHYGKAKPGGH